MFEARPKSRHRWALTPEAFECLLARLSPDRETAGREFENLRRHLAGILTYAGGADPERLADEVLDRAAKRLSEGEVIENLRTWTRGAAKKVLQEERRQAAIEIRGLEEVRNVQAGPDAIDSRRAEEDYFALMDCMHRLAPESRALIDRYYRSSGGNLLSSRKQLAEELGITTEALRTRALRLRKRLERCLGESRGRDDGEA